MSVGGAPLDETRRYVLATHDFLAAGGNGYTVFAGHEPVYNDSGRWLRVVLDEWWRRRGERLVRRRRPHRGGPAVSLVRIRFNGEERVLAAGLRVRSLLTHEQVEQVQRGELVVLDGKGRERGLDGALLDGLALRLAPRPRA